MGGATPLACVVDETGYLKYRRSGTYVFDVEGNLFRLSRREVKEMVESKIIVVT